MNKFFILLFLVISNFGVSQSNIDSKTKFDSTYNRFADGDWKYVLNEINDPKLKKSYTEFERALLLACVTMDSVSYEKGLPLALKAKKIMPKKATLKDQRNMNFMLGKIYFNLAEYDKAIKYFYQVDLIGTKMGVPNNVKTANFYLGQIYVHLEKPVLSKKHFRKAIRVAKEINDTAGVCKYTIFLCQTFATQSQIDTKNMSPLGDSIFASLNNLKKYCPKLDPILEGYYLSALSNAYSLKGDLINQKKYAIPTFHFFMEIGDIDNAIISCAKLGTAFLDLGNYDSALIFYKKADELKANHSGFANADDRNYHHDYYKVYRGLNDYKNALSHLEKFIEMDNALNKDKSYQFQLEKEKFEQAKNNEIIENNRKNDEALFEQKQKYNLYLTISIVASILLVLGLILLRFKSKKDRERKNLQILLKNAELTALKSQMNPHFIFNALNSIQHSIISNQTDEAYKFLSKFSKLIRNVLETSSETFIPLEQELETLQLYSDIESKRFEHSFKYSIQVGENIDQKTMKIPPMILQPIIENSIWHGLMPKDGEKLLTISFKSEKTNELLCEVIDNGIGREKAKELNKEKKHSHKSIALENINERIQILSQMNLCKINYETIDLFENGNSCGTKVSFKIQYQ